MSSASPPVLPLPRQPSPLSFSSISANDQDQGAPSSPVSPSLHLPSTLFTPVPIASSSRLPAIPGSVDPTPTTDQRTVAQPPPSPTEHLTSRPLPPTEPTHVMPVDPQSDSLLLRSTFVSLDQSAATLKRLTKTVLASTHTYLALLDQVGKVEDDLFSHLGELGRWLESGYGISESSVWDDDGGVRKIRRDSRKKEREETEAMVEHGLKAVKSELKRNGLAGTGAQSRFENSAKQYYQQTSAYLAPTSSTSNGLTATPQTLPSSSASLGASGSTSEELAQATRTAQFDLVRYSHHSTLLYAVPPASITCIDLLVGLYTWASGLLGEVSPGRRPSFARGVSGTESGAGTARLVSGENTTSSASVLKSSISDSLTRLGDIRADLLLAWGKRNAQTSDLEGGAADRFAEFESTVPEGRASPRSPDPSPLGISPSGIEHKRPRKIHKLHKVGGRLRDLLTSGSSTNLAAIERGSDRPRASLDMLRSDASPRLGSPIEDPGLLPAASFPPTSRAPSRQPAVSRHSMHVTRATDYVSPFIASQAANASSAYASSTDLTAPAAGDGEIRRVSGVGGVGGLGAGGDEDEKREEAGRKKEGVLWGAGTWEGLTSKPSAKSRWERFWVVLDHSKIYEYRENVIDRPDSAHEIIDLKFASVREGRGTDRRFVFEVVTPRQGRRLYQATSETEMKQWLYAICNAIESSINGTSSVRTFDTSKLRTPSGALDDHAVPPRRLFPPSSRSLGIGLPRPAGSNTPANRQSVPPPSRTPPSHDSESQREVSEDKEKRSRKTSLKKVLRQSAEIAGEKWNSVMTYRNPSGLDVPRTSHSQSNSRASTRTSTDEYYRVSSSRAMDSSSTGSQGRSTTTPGETSSWVDDGDGDIERSVFAMAGLDVSQGGGPNRRVVSESTAKTLARLEGRDPPASDMTRTKSADAGLNLSNCSEELLRIAELPENRLCADCGRGMKSSRWATLSLRDVPMVMFLCIRCVGVHRGLGTHISKPRSVDLDRWTPESVALARQWGNGRANAMWEEEKPESVIVDDKYVADFIRAKYVEGRWLSAEQRAVLGISPRPAVGGAARVVGQAV